MSRVLFGILILGGILVGLVALGELGFGPVVVTQEDEQKLILMLGDPRDSATEPGWSLRWPLIEEVRTFDRRWLYLSSAAVLIQTRDRERIVVDNYVVWRISDPLQFYKSFPTGISEAREQIKREVEAVVRGTIGRRTLNEVVSDARIEIMDDVTQKSAATLERFGVEVNDVRINRTELPEGTEENVYARMRAERERQARKNRAEGEKAAREIRAEADRQARVIVAQARKQAEVERGLGDAESARIYAEAYSTEPRFYRFVRSLEAYRKTLGEAPEGVL